MTPYKRDSIYQLITRLESLAYNEASENKLNGLVYDLSNALLDDDEAAAEKYIDAAYDFISEME